jgi:hypothetical protein
MFGYSFEAEKLVPALQSDAVISSWDCGARGRWVKMNAGPLISFCAKGSTSLTELAQAALENCDWTTSIDIGGSHPDTSLGDGFLVRRGEIVVGRFIVANRTPTPFEWYQLSDLSYDVGLDIAP